MGEYMKRIIAILLLLNSINSFCKNDSPLSFSEVMFNAPSGNNEFIEIYNTSQQSIDLSGYKIKYYTSTPDDIVSISTNTILQPFSFAIIFEGDYDFANGIYNEIIPSSALILKIDNNSFGTSGMANTTDRPIYLLNPNGDTIDTYLYFADNQQAFSDEKIILNDDNNPANWKNSIYKYGTPGFKNSVSQKDNDLIISSFYILPIIPIQNENIAVNITIKNIGLSVAENFQVEMYLDLKLDSLINDDEQVFREYVNNLPSQDSLIFSTNIKNLNVGNYQLIAKVIFNSDEDTLNNFKMIPFFVYSLPNNFNDIVINEIMYTPAPDQEEWVELYNKTDSPINLKKWTLSDNSSHTEITLQDKFLPEGGFLILCKDTLLENYYDAPIEIIQMKLPTLNNSGDIIRIADSLNSTIDSLGYSPDWGGSKEGKSLERISVDDASTDSSNWMTSLSKSGATPGNINSVTNLKGYEKNSLIINEIMFDPSANNSEFVELLNISNSPVDIGGWKLIKSENSFQNISDESFIIPGSGYFVFAADSIIFENYPWLKNSSYNIANQSSLGLSSSEGKLIVKDVKGNTIDSVYYSSNWHNKNILNTKNKSLERINPLIDSNNPGNWYTAVNPEGATPGKANSILVQNEQLEEKISVLPNPFSPDNDGFEDFTIINYNLNQTLAQVRIKIFDSQGRLVRTLLNNQASGSSGSVIFDGMNDAGNPLRMGIYIIFFEALNESAGALETMKTVVVVARKL
jgi:hypothetical protein